MKHQFSIARQVRPDVPTALAVGGVLVPSGRHTFAGLTLYALASLQPSIDHIEEQKP